MNQVEFMNLNLGDRLLAAIFANVEPEGSMGPPSPTKEQRDHALFYYNQAMRERALVVAKAEKTAKVEARKAQNALEKTERERKEKIGSFYAEGLSLLKDDGFITADERTQHRANPVVEISNAIEKRCTLDAVADPYGFANWEIAADIISEWFNKELK
jgi:hypothetical protein